MQARHVLACTDLSPESLNAVEHAANHARANKSHLTLLHVLDPQSFIPPQAVLDPQAGFAPHKEEAQAALAKIRDEKLSGLDGDAVLIVDHAPARATCEYAAKHDVDLIVVGSHGRSGVDRWLIGSVTARAVHHAH